MLGSTPPYENSLYRSVLNRLYILKYMSFFAYPYDGLIGESKKPPPLGEVACDSKTEGVINSSTRCCGSPLVEGAFSLSFFAYLRDGLYGESQSCLPLSGEGNRYAVEG